MRFFKYLVFIVLSFVYVNTFAATEYWNTARPNEFFSTALDACINAVRKANYPNTTPTVSADGTKCYSNGPGTYQVGSIRSQAACPSTVTSNSINVPGWSNWDIDQTEFYHNQIANRTACYKGCKYKDPAIGGSDPQLHLIFGDPVKDSSCPNTETKPNTPSPNNPNEPNPPQECKNETGSDSYCPKPPQGCPPGYSEQSFNGEAICVKDSPQNPNPNDPNNDDNQPPASEPNGGDNGGNNNGGGDVDLTPVINAINSLKNALVSAINSVSSKINTLITGQEKTNDHLDKIEKESVKTNQKLDISNEHLYDIQKELVKTNNKLDQANEKLDKSNDHLKNISDYSKAASEAIGESNKKLDVINDSIQAQYKCENESYDSRNPDSQKYRDCTQEDMQQGESDSNVSIGDLGVPDYQKENHVVFGQSCPFSENTTVVDFGVSSFLLKTNLSFICDYGHLARPYVIGIGHLLCLIFLVYGLRNNA